ncbi:MAG: DUF2059 domain-containing protein [Pseudomonadota bacterium]|nr:DUF2059 domain-containing protein [Pseudomonadota bacterium]
MKLKTKLTLVVALLMPLAATAAPPSDASIEELMRITKAEATADATKAQLEPMMRSMMADMKRGDKLTPEQQRAFEQFPAKFADLMREEMGWAKMKPQMVELYREVFTQEEVDGQIAFYSSPTGQAVIAKMPLLVQKSMVMTERQMQAVMPRLQAAMEQALADAKAGR